jgi:hypothetical protein
MRNLFCRNDPSERKLHEMGDKASPAREYAIADAIDKVKRILDKIEEGLK